MVTSEVKKNDASAETNQQQDHIKLIGSEISNILRAHVLVPIKYTKHLNQLDHKALWHLDVDYNQCVVATKAIMGITGGAIVGSGVEEKLLSSALSASFAAIFTTITSPYFYQDITPVVVAEIVTLAAISQISAQIGMYLTTVGFAFGVLGTVGSLISTIALTKFALTSIMEIQNKIDHKETHFVEKILDFDSQENLFAFLTICPIFLGIGSGLVVKAAGPFIVTALYKTITGITVWSMYESLPKPLCKVITKATETIEVYRFLSHDELISNGYHFEENNPTAELQFTTNASIDLEPAGENSQVSHEEL